MPPRISQQDRRLIAAYQEAALRLNRLIASVNDPRQRAILLRRIDELLNQLDQITADYIRETLPLHFKDGSDEAIRSLRALKGFSGELDETFGTIHKEAMQALADDAALKFANALQGVKLEAQNRISKAQKLSVMSELLTSEIEGAARPQDRVKSILQEQGFISIQGRRKWSLEDYSAMLTHTVLADAHNTGAATRYASHGVAFARRIERPDCCRICRPLRGKIINIADPRLLPPTHPNCMGGIEPIIGEPNEEPIMSPADPRIPEDTRRFLENKV